MNKQKQVVAVVAAFALALVVGCASTQQGSASRGASASAAQQKVRQMEATVDVTTIDRAARIVYVRSRKETQAVHLPADIDISKIQVGSRYKVRYSEPVATVIEPGAQSAAAGATRQAESGAKPGEGVVTAKTAGVVEQMDAARRQVTLRTLEGGTQTFSLAEGVAAESFKTGQAVTVTYRQAAVSQLISAPGAQLTDPYQYPSGA